MLTAYEFARQPIIVPAMLRRSASTISTLLQLPNIVLTRSGRSALLLALQQLGTQPGDRVLVPTYHCPTMIAPVERLGAVPLFYPITPGGGPDMDFLNALDGRPVRAILVAHLFGLPISLTEVKAFCSERGIGLIEDCAHCFFGAADGISVGAVGDFAIGSLPKFFPVIEGGLLGSASRQINIQPLQSSTLKQEFRAAWDILDMSSRVRGLGLLGSVIRKMAHMRKLIGRSTSEAILSTLPDNPEALRQASLADPLLQPANIRRVERWLLDHSDSRTAVRQRNRNFQNLREQMRGVAGARPLSINCTSSSAPYVLPLYVDEPDDAYQAMRQLGLPVFRWDRVWPGTPTLNQDSGKLWSRHVVQIACHQALGDADISQLAKRLRHCLGTAE